MTFTYSNTSIGTALAKVRLAIGDTDSTDALFTDEEINVYLGNNADAVEATAADLCEVLATRFSRDIDFETDQQKFQRSQRVANYRAMAEELRDRANAGGGISSGTMTKVDGYSDEISSRDTSANPASGRVKAGYYDPDIPV